MRFDVITIFPEIFDSYLKESLISKALKKKIIEFKAHDLRSWSQDKRKTIDSKCFGGGLGMVIKVEPILKCVLSVKKKNLKSKTILLTPRGRKFNQKKAYQFSKLDQLIIISGRYEGVDERVAKYIADEEVSVGDYILMGGEIPSLAIFEATARLVPGVVNSSDFLNQKTEKEKRLIKGMIEVPQYTRPEIFVPSQFVGTKLKNKMIKKTTKWKVPKDLISGDHKKIELWRKKHGQSIWN